MFSKSFSISAMILTLSIISFIIPGQLSAATNNLDYLNSYELSDYVDVCVIMNERPDISYLNQITDKVPRNQRSYIVWNELKRLVENSQKNLTRELETNLFSGMVKDYRSISICNGIALTATREFVETLAGRDDILYILDDSLKRTGDTDYIPTPTTELDEIAWSIVHIGAPDVWAEGYTGEDILVAVIDTGVNWHHADLANQLWDGGDEYPRHGYDFQDDDYDPDDIYGHGTAVAGIIGGDGSAGDTTGIAPDVKLMCLRVRENLSIGVVTSTWSAQDFALEHGADITSMSLGWSSPGEEDRQIWRNNYDVLDAAGIINIKSGGNRRRSVEPPGAISVPGDVPSPWQHPDEIEMGTRGGVITVGATNEADTLNMASSPGPVTWQDQDPWNDYLLDSLHVGLIKPDISAPGTNGHTLNSGNDNGYVSFLNTSMAQPHVAGTVALMLSKNPELLPVEVDSILQTTALDLGIEGKDNDFGAGRVQAYEAVLATPEVSSVSEDIDPSLPNKAGIISELRVSPNPFNEDTRISFYLSERDKVNVIVYNYMGQLVCENTLGQIEAGEHVMNWQSIHQKGSHPASGIYFIAVKGINSQKTIKIAYLK